MELLEFVLSDLWIFIGFIIILSAVLKFIFLMWNRIWRHLNIRKHGWPPVHCDADGDLKEEKEKNHISIG